MKWNWEMNNGENELWLEGMVSADDDDAYMRDFRAALADQHGRDLTVWLNSAGGRVQLASRIYTALREYPGKIVIKVDGMAASAASLIAMAGDELLMTVPSMMMIHGPSIGTWGNEAAHDKSMELLRSLSDAMADAYCSKTHRPKDEIQAMMDTEVWMSASKAVKLGFADGILDGRDRALAPVACLLTTSGVYAYSGTLRAEPGREAEELEAIVQAARAQIAANKKKGASENGKGNDNLRHGGKPEQHQGGTGYYARLAGVRFGGQSDIHGGHPGEASPRQ